MTKRWSVRLAGAVALIAAVVTTALVALVRDDTGNSVNRSDAALGNGPAYAIDATSEPARRSAPQTSTPSSAPASGLRSSPVARTVPAPAAGSGAMTPPRSVPPLTYTVKRGDNLTVIAHWFKLHGYGALYERNRKVIGDDPDLIVPGQRITISSAGVTTSR